MADAQQSCSGFDLGELQFDHELRAILDALFCACLEELQTRDKLMQRDLFRMIEIEGQTLAAAASTLGLDATDAEQLHTSAMRDVAVLMALGLCKPAGGRPANEARFGDCRC